MTNSSPDDAQDVLIDARLVTALAWRQIGGHWQPVVLDQKSLLRLTGASSDFLTQRVEALIANKIIRRTFENNPPLSHLDALQLMELMRRERAAFTDEGVTPLPESTAIPAELSTGKRNYSLLEPRTAEEHMSELCRVSMLAMEQPIDEASRKSHLEVLVLATALLLRGYGEQAFLQLGETSTEFTIDTMMRHLNLTVNPVLQLNGFQNRDGTLNFARQRPQLKGQEAQIIDIMSNSPAFQSVGVESIQSLEPVFSLSSANGRSNRRDLSAALESP